MTAHELNRVLEQAAIALDLPETLAEDAVLEYEAVAVWLAAPDSPLAKYMPEIYPQGSFRLGTPVRPLRQGDDFDIDLVCRLALTKEETSQRVLKEQVGARLLHNVELAPILEEKRRCWTLNYAGRYHLDVLPAIRDSAGSPEAILIADRDMARWQPSNPLGYAQWFFDRMGPLLLQEQQRLAGLLGASIEDVPRWRIRTPLQRAVQLLKRHRDLRFSHDDVGRPISIIITTLAALAYSGEQDTASALHNISATMARHIESRRGVWWVSNPAQTEENFADKWNENPRLHAAFVTWLQSAQADLTAAAETASLETSQVLLERTFGSGSASTALVRQFDVPGLSDTSHAEAPKWPMRSQYRCAVKCWVHPRYKSGKQLWRLRRIGVPKNAGLHFIATTDAPPPYKVYWQVTNTGNEAAEAGQLRGGFDLSEDGANGTRWERTAYTGTHLVTAFVVKANVCVSQSEPVSVRVRPISMSLHHGP